MWLRICDLFFTLFYGTESLLEEYARGRVSGNVEWGRPCSATRFFGILHAGAGGNVHQSGGRPDLVGSLDQRTDQAPNLKGVSLVVGWFGTRDDAGGFPAVAQLKALAAECRGIVGPGIKLSYAADWSEYFGRQTGGEAIFHLDPLWADANIDYVGIDWYPPLSDWRAGAGGPAGETWAG